MNQQPTQDPLYAGPRQGARAQYNGNNSSPNTGPAYRPNGKVDDAPESNQNRAARYEDEKRRIVESCFSRREDDGVAAESYITHVRVVEDGGFPSSPPPPDSPAANKKGRVILVAVKKNGRVRLHKARENPTGTFSIGKTWPLEELSSIQSYTNLIPRNDQEHMEKQWADGNGFIVTLGKPYYWQAPTSKEKDFFIASLVKIYRKYTGGKLPELYGFATQEVELMTGTPVTPNPQVRSPLISSQTIAPPPPIPAAAERPPPPSPQSFRSQGSDQASRARAQSRNEQGPPARDVHRPPPIEPLRSPARGEERQQFQDINRSQRSLEGVSKSVLPEQPSSSANYLTTINSRPSASPQSSQHSQPIEKTNGRLPNGVPLPPQPLYADAQQRRPSSAHSGSSRPSTAVSDQRSYEPRIDKTPSHTDSPPDKRRQYLARGEAHLAPRSGAASESNSQFATPAATPSDLREEKVPEFPLINHDYSASPPAASQDREPFTPNKDVGPTNISNTGLSEEPQLITEQPSAPVNDASSTQAESTTAKKQEEEYRPGLGPMIKKKSAKDIAGQFRKAAIAAGAFQPRQGGAGARLKALQDKDKVSNEPDGITSVVPAPLLRGMSADSASSTPAAAVAPVSKPSQDHVSAQVVNETQSTTEIHHSATENITSESESQVPIARGAVSVPTILTPEKPKPEVRSPSPEKPRSRSPERKKRQRQEAEISKYCSALGIDVRLFEGRGADFNDLLTEFGWDGKLRESRRIEDFETDIKREIGRAQATGWLGHVEQQEGKVQDLAKAFDKAIEECEELDGLFTLYSHELDTLSSDIEYIEAQSQGLQVQTANQKLLQNELNGLLRTLTIPSSDLRGLQTGSLDSETGVETVEHSLILLYKALITIDPDIRQNKIRQTVGHNTDRGGIGVYADTEIGQMRAVREKKEHYREATGTFVKRFNLHMTSMFKNVDETSFENERQRLWKYNAMMLFVREVNSYEWQTLITSYEMNLKGTYQNQFRDYAMTQRKAARKPGLEELEALFTTQDKEKSEETLTSSAARKLTVKRGKTVKAGALRQQLGDKRDGRLDAHEIFGTVLKYQGRAIAEEQNFLVCFFHLNSQTSGDFAEITTTKTPGQRKLPNLNAKQPYDPDRNMAKIVQGVIEGIYSFWLMDLQNLLDWALAMDALQGVGVLAAIEQCLAVYEETNQEYITRTLRTLHERLTGLFHKFVDEQIKAIEETKVKVSKRKGIVLFMRTFPLFSAVIEQMVPQESVSSDVLEVRFIVNDSYNKILKAMWESLSFIAKDAAVAGPGGTSSTAPGNSDPEDKEALNYHILLIENMNHYLEEVDTMKNVVLDEWADKARSDFSTHLTQYVDAVIRRPLGKWLDFLESTEAMMKNSEASGISGKPSHSRSAAKKVLSSHDCKEIRKGIETLKKRVEKHFGDLDDPSSASKSLIQRVLEECSSRYASAHSRMDLIIRKVYDGTLEIDWRKEDAAAIFKR